MAVATVDGRTTTETTFLLSRSIDEINDGAIMDNCNNSNNTNDADDDFAVVKLSSNVYMCKERHYACTWNVPNMYVVKGSRLDLNIDTGVGLWNNKQFLVRQQLIDDNDDDEHDCGGIGGGDQDEESQHHPKKAAAAATAEENTDDSTTRKKAYMAVVTHVHFDHAGGLWQFGNDRSAIHEQELPAIETGDDVEACTFMRKSDCAKNPPSPTWKPTDYRLRPVQPKRILFSSTKNAKGDDHHRHHHHDDDQEDEEVFEMGDGHVIKVLHTPGHSRGSICLWDEQNGVLFSGDTVYDGQLLDVAPYSNIEDYISTMELLLTICPNVTRVFPGHGPEIDGRRLRQICQQYIDNVTKCHLCTSHIVQSLVRVVLNGRNNTRKRDHAKATCQRCCYYSSCCCLLLGPALSKEEK